MKNGKNQKSSSARSRKGSHNTARAKILSHGGGSAGKRDVGSAPIDYDGALSSYRGAGIGEPASTEKSHAVQNHGNVYEINGALTDKVVKQLWERGGSDVYGIDAHSLKIKSIESLGRRQCSKVRELDVSFDWKLGTISERSSGRRRAATAQLAQGTGREDWTLGGRTGDLPCLRFPRVTL